MDGIVVRDATIGEGAAIAACKRESWRATYAGLLPEAFLAELQLMPPPDAYDRQARAGNPAAVAIRDGRIVGLAFVHPEGAEGMPAGTGLLMMLYTLPEVWGTGVGYALHRAALARMRAQGATSAVLWVLDGNRRAITFYERQGWQPDGATQVETIAGVELPELRYRLASLDG